MHRPRVQRSVGLAGLLLLLAAGAARADPEWLRGAPRELGAPPSGARVRLEIEGGSTHPLGENLKARLVLRNDGDRPFRALYNGFRDAARGGRMPAVRVAATDERGRPVADPFEDAMGGAGNGPVGVCRLHPGDELTHAFRLDRYLALDRPGTYRVRVFTDYGWTADAERPLPVATLTLTLHAPEAAEAARVVDATLARIGKAERGEGAGHVDLASLRHPIYVPALVRHLTEGELRAVEGLAAIPDETATRALLDATDHPNGAVVRAVAGALARRDIPQGLAETGRARMRDLLAATGDGPTGSAAARVLLEVGRTEDAQAIVSLLDRVLPLAPARDPGIDFILGPPMGLRGAVEALQGFAAKGAPLPDAPLGAGGILLWLACAREGKAETDEVDDRCLVWLRHRVPYVREAALRHLSAPRGLRRALDEVRALSASRDGGVLLALCERFEPLGREVRGGPALGLVRVAANPFLLRAASKLALAQGLRSMLVEAWISRLDEREMVVEVLRNLADLLVATETRGGSGNSNLTLRELADLHDAWDAFWRAQRPEIQEGRRWEVGDPALDPALFGRAYSLRLEDGTTWPPPEASER